MKANALGRLQQQRQQQLGRLWRSAPLKARGSGLQAVSAQAQAVSAASPVVVAEPTTADRPSCELSGVLHTPHPSMFLNKNTSFVEEFRIRGNECGPDQHANIITIANLLQEVGGNHGVALWGRSDSGFAAMPGMDHLIFVATRIQIRMAAYPKWGDLVRLETYFADDGRLTTRRDWLITDAVTGAHLGAATSTWVTINAETRRLSKLPESVRARWLSLAPAPPRAVLPPGETKRKLGSFPGEPALSAPRVVARRGDMDPNGHINNVCYLSWALEAAPERIVGGYDLVEVEMDFKAECTAGDAVEVLGHPLTDLDNGNGCAQQLLHTLRKPGGVEVWRARTTWRPKKAAAAAAAAAQ